MDQPITIALTKGRILKETLPLLAEAGIEPLEDISSSRKLIFATNHSHIQLIVIRGTDVPTYVKLGSADLGIAGKDMLLELGADDMYEPLDLNIARCKLMTAGRVGEALPVALLLAEAGLGMQQLRFAVLMPRSVLLWLTNTSAKRWIHQMLGEIILPLMVVLLHRPPAQCPLL